MLSGKGKKKVLFYNDKTANESAQIDEDLIKLWRNVAVDGLDEAKIEDYLEKKNITSMKGDTVSSFLLAKDSKKTRKQRQFKRHNEHLDGVLQDYNPELSVASKKHKKDWKFWKLILFINTSLVLFGV